MLANDRLRGNGQNKTTPLTLGNEPSDKCGIFFPVHRLHYAPLTMDPAEKGQPSSESMDHDHYCKYKKKGISVFFRLRIPEQCRSGAYRILITALGVESTYPHRSKESLRSRYYMLHSV